MVDLSGPIFLIGSAVVSPSGIGATTLNVPSGVQPGTTTYWQGVEVFSFGSLIIRHSNPAVAVVN
jgi:hypothetical protein